MPINIEALYDVMESIDKKYSVAFLMYPHFFFNTLNAFISLYFMLCIQGIK